VELKNIEETGQKFGKLVESKVDIDEKINQTNKLSRTVIVLMLR